jgi:hypothetical protein
MNIQEIKQAITKLSPDDLARFRKWFAKFDSNSKSYKLTKSQPSTEDLGKKLRGSLKGSGAFKALMEERRKS